MCLHVLLIMQHVKDVYMCHLCTVYPSMLRHSARGGQAPLHSGVEACVLRSSSSCYMLVGTRSRHPALST